MNWLVVNLVSWLLFFFGAAFPILIVLKAIGLTGFMKVTRFESYHTFYYRMNPSVKIMLGIVVTVVAAMTIWWIGAIMTVIVLLSYFTLKDGKRKFITGFFLTMITIIGTTWAFAPYTPYTILQGAFHTSKITGIWTWPSYFAIMGYQPELSVQGLIYGFQISMRFTTVALMSLVLVMTSTPSQVLRALNKIGIPISITFSLVVAMRTIPRIFEYIDTSVKIQFMRGLGSNAPRVLRPFYMLKGAIYAIVPVIVFLVRGALDTAISADTRAFRAYPGRTNMRPVTIGPVDKAAFVITALALFITVAAVIMGFGRAIPYS
ncbi:MAG: energy-coupling factor transporter transmembrane protein EcfT [Candidatus Thermoplasmatota archaeon]|nr:energy-coupling factor transporter transmembrane protein EcfT [Candidatus Thermoplasmatota archaeon]